MPGVQVVTGTRPGPADLQAAPESTFFVSGQAERGDTVNAVRVRSMAEYADRLGARVTYGTLYDQLETFFAEGGTLAYVARTVGPAATKGTLSLLDRAGTPLATVAIDALGEGAWSSGLTVEVQNGTATNTYRIVLRLAGDTETYDNLAAPADAVTALASSKWARARNVGSATVAPNNNPAVLAATALSAGSDDRASITATHYTNALARFTPGLGVGAVAVPGQAASAVGTALIAHAKANYRIALLAPAVGRTVSQAQTDAATYRAADGEYAGFFFPWVQIPDGAGGLRTISPEGYVAAMRARAIFDTGVWEVPAGQVAVARHIVGVELALTSTDVNTLYDAAVNPIWLLTGGLRLYGWRSLSTDTLNYRNLTGRDVLNMLAFRGGQVLEQFVFRPVDSKGQLFALIDAALRGLVAPIAQDGGLYPLFDADGTPLDPGYAIDTGPSINTPDSLAQNLVKAQLAVRVAPSADTIRLTITKTAIGTSF